MKILRHFLQIVLAVLLVQVALAQHEHHSPEPAAEQESKKTYLVDEFGSLGHCDVSSRLDAFFQELSQKTDAQGYFIFYRNAGALPGSREAASYERLFKNHIAFRGFPSERVTLIDGGYSSELRTELWIAPAGGERPVPSKSVPEPELQLGKTFLFDKTSVLGDEGAESILEFELAAVKAKREAEAAEREAEYEREEAERNRELEASGVVVEEAPEP